MSDDATAQDEQPPLLKIVTPGTTPEEVAAIVAVFASLGPGDGDAPDPRRTPEWNRPARLTRTTHRHGPAAWRASGLPR